jgi:hypothetical protein
MFAIVAHPPENKVERAMRRKKTRLDRMMKLLVK